MTEELTYSILADKLKGTLLKFEWFHKCSFAYSCKLDGELVAVYGVIEYGDYLDAEEQLDNIENVETTIAYKGVVYEYDK